MAATTTAGLRRSLVAVLILTLTLAGLGRAVASAPQPGVVGMVVAGVQVPICHAGEAPADPAPPAPHDCCDDCALLAVAVLPAPPALSNPVAVAHGADHARAVARAPAMARPRSPRLSRGPPVA